MTKWSIDTRILFTLHLVGMAFPTVGSVPIGLFVGWKVLGREQQD